MSNRLSMARPDYLLPTTVTPPSLRTNPPTTLPPTTTTLQITTTSTTTIRLTPYSYDEVSLPPPTAEEAALIKVLEEAVKIEHERREENRNKAHRQQDQIQSRHHSPHSESPKKIKIPRCSCGRVGYTFGGSRVPGFSRSRGRIYNRFSNAQCRCRSEVENKRLEQQYQEEFDKI